MPGEADSAGAAHPARSLRRSLSARIGPALAISSRLGPGVQSNPREQPDDADRGGVRQVTLPSLRLRPPLRQQLSQPSRELRVLPALVHVTVSPSELTARSLKAVTGALSSTTLAPPKRRA